MPDASAHALPHDCFQDMGELSCGDFVMAILQALRPLRPGDVMEIGLGVCNPRSAEVEPVECIVDKANALLHHREPG